MIDHPTIYIYPLEEKLLISQKFNLFFDNLRTDEKILTCEKNIRYCFQKDRQYQISEEFLTEHLHKFLRNKASESIYFDKLWMKYSKLNGFEILSRMWIVENWEGSETPSGDLNFLFSTLLGIPGNYFNELLLEEDNFLFGDSFVSDTIKSVYRFLVRIVDTELLRKIVSTNIRHIREKGIESKLSLAIMETDWFDFYKVTKQFFFPEIKENFLEISSLIDKPTHDGFEEMLFFLSDYLRLVDYAKDDRIKIVFMVSIIETLICHCPSSRSDSLNNQFQTKVVELVNKNNIIVLPNQLREIYRIRSDIAHGKFKSLKTYPANDENVPWGPIKNEPYTSAKIKLSQYVLIIIKEYLNDPRKIDDLKKR